MEEKIKDKIKDTIKDKIKGTAAPRDAPPGPPGQQHGDLTTNLQQHGDIINLHTHTDTEGRTDRRTERRTERRSSVHRRHMPMEPLKFHIPKKNKEHRALFQFVSTESREYEDMLTILTSSYRDAGSTSCFTYSKPRLIHSQLLETEFVEKRKEMKADGRTDKELEECHCFLLADTSKLPLICEKGLLVSHSWITALGNPNKGVYLSKYSDLLQINPFSPGDTGEIIIFKTMKGKVKSIYDNMSKNLLDPTPRFDSHLSKNASTVTSLTSYRAFELTQHFFYEYSFDELRRRPRQVCPYAVITFQFKGKDALPPSKPPNPLRLNSQSAEGGKERAQFTVWNGDFVKGDQLLLHLSLLSFSPPFLPYRLPEKLEIGWLMSLNHVNKLLPSALFSWNLYAGSHEVVKNGRYCSLLEVVERRQSEPTVSSLLQGLEASRLVLVTPLPDRGFLFLLSSVQMATPTERGEGWKRCLQALFVFPESRDVAKSTSSCDSSSHNASVSSCSVGPVMPRLNCFLPALHHALVKARASPPAQLSAGVELQVSEYLSGQNDGKVRHYPMGEYDSKLDERGKLFPAPKHHRLNMDGYLRSYLYSPALYLLSVARAKHLVELHCGPEESRPWGRHGPQRKIQGRERKSNSGEERLQQLSNPQKMQQLIDLVLTCKRNAEREVRRQGEERKEGGAAQEARGTKRKLEQEMAERTLKYLRSASQEAGGDLSVLVEDSQSPSSLCSLSSVIGSVGLKDVDLRKDGSEAAVKLLSLLTGLNQAARGTANQSQPEEQGAGQSESWPFDRLATKLGLPTNCDIDLRKREELEEQTAGSVSSLEGFSPSSHSGETAPRGGTRGGQGRRAGGEEEEEEEEIPWVLIPITGLRCEKYSQRERDIPQDPRFIHNAMATGTATTRSPPPSASHSPSRSPANEDHSPANEEHLSPVAPWESAGGTKDREERPLPQDEERRNQVTISSSLPPSVPPSLPPAPERSKHSSPYPTEERAEEEQWKVEEVEGEQLQEEEERKEKKLEKEERQEEEEMEVIDEVAGHEDEEREGEATELKEHSLPPPLPHQDVDGIVEEHLGDFSSEIQHLLQKNIHYNLPRGLHCSAHTHTATHTRTPTQTPLVGFSQYVCFYNPSPPIQDYVSSLRDSISTVLLDSEVSWPTSYHANASTADANASTADANASSADAYANSNDMLASNICDYLASIRAANTNSSRAGVDSANCSDTAASSGGTSVSQNLSLSRGGDSWSQGTTTEHLSRAVNDRQPSVLPPQGTPSIHTSSHQFPGSVTTTHHPARSPHLLPSRASDHPIQHTWLPQQQSGLHSNRAVGHEADSLRQIQHNSKIQTNSRLSDTDNEVTLPGLAGGPPPSSEPSNPAEEPLGVPPAEPLSCPASVSVPGPDRGPAAPAVAISSLISQLQPEVFSSLVKIIKDVRRKSLQFYIHSSEQDDQVCQDIKEYLLKQGNVEQSPVGFLEQENHDDRLLVIIQNKHIAEHIHKIPGLVSLKRRSSVMFVGVDSVEDVRNHSYNELFVSGGCIVSDDFILNPDFITHERLAALLMFLEQQSSAESVWRWRVHCKTQKNLKQQSRFKRDAAILLDVLSAYQKRLIVEFLPYHHCDMTSRQSATDLTCLIELQARYTQQRHIIFLTERRFEMFPKYSSSGIIIANIDDIMHNFTSLVGYHDIKDKQPITDDLLAPKGVSSRRLSHEDSGSQLSPSSFPEHSVNNPHLLQASPGLGQQDHLLPPTPIPDQLVPESHTPPSSSSSSSNEGPQNQSEADFEALRLAISQFRAERQARAQRRQEEPEEEFSVNLQSHPNPAFLGGPMEQIQLTPGGCSIPPAGQGGPGELTQLIPGRKALVATLESIHSALDPEGEEEEAREGGGGGRGGQLLGRSKGGRGGDQPDTVSNDCTEPISSASNNRERADHQGEAAFPSLAKEGSTSCPVGGDKARDRQPGQEQPIGDRPPGQEQPIGGEMGPPITQDHQTGGITMVTGQDSPSLALPQQQLQNQIHQHQLHLQQENHRQQYQQLNQQLHQNHHLHHRPPLNQQQGGTGLLPHPGNLALLSNQPFYPNPMLGPLAALGGMSSFLGPGPVWPGGLGPPGAALLWGFQQPGREFPVPGMTGTFQSPGGQGSSSGAALTRSLRDPWEPGALN